MDDADLDTIDDLPAPRQSQLALVTIMKVCTRATRRALDEDPEDRLRMHKRCILGLLPADAATQTLDGWTRLGAHAGALAGFAGIGWRVPGGAPSPRHAALYGAAWTFANAIVSEGVRHGG